MVNVLVSFCLHSKVHKAWNEVPELILLGPEKCPKLPVFSFVIKQTDSGLYLHHNFVCALLNDLFGIQSRGGCSCAGPYAQVRGWECTASPNASL